MKTLTKNKITRLKKQLLELIRNTQHKSFQYNLMQTEYKRLTLLRKSL